MPVAIEPGFDDIDVGDFEGEDVRPIALARAPRARRGDARAARAVWRRSARYADGCARLLARHDAERVLLVVHDMPIRFLRNALLRR